LKYSRRRKDSYFDSALMERPSMVKLIKKPDYFDYIFGEIRKHVNEGESELPPGSLNAHLLRNASYGFKIKPFEFSTYMKKEKENTVDHMNYRQ
jgi:hypothetical protein